MLPISSKMVNAKEMFPSTISRSREIKPPSVASIRTKCASNSPRNTPSYWIPSFTEISASTASWIDPPTTLVTTSPSSRLETPSVARAIAIAEDASSPNGKSVPRISDGIRLGSDAPSRRISSISRISRSSSIGPNSTFTPRCSSSMTIGSNPLLISLKVSICRAASGIVRTAFRAASTSSSYCRSASLRYRVTASSERPLCCAALSAAAATSCFRRPWSTSLKSSTEPPNTPIPPRSAFCEPLRLASARALIFLIFPNRPKSASTLTPVRLKATVPAPVIKLV